MKFRIHINVLFIFIICVLIAFTLCTTNYLYSQVSEISTLVAEKIKGDIYIHKSGGSNLILFNGEDGLLIIDSGISQRASDSDSLIKASFKKPIKYIVNTHAHFDHVGGNDVFAKNGEIIIASLKTREAMMKEWDVSDVPNVNFPVIPPYPKEFLPKICFNDSIQIHMIEEVIKLVHFPGGHSGGDVVVYFSKANVIHMGDLFLTNAFPPVSNIEIYINVLEQIIETCNANTIVIPGHGAVSDKEGLITYKNLISNGAERILNLKSEGKTFEEVMETKPLKNLLEKESWVPEVIFIYCIYYNYKV